MAFEVACRCGARFAAEDHLSGQIVPCPRCGQPLSILSPAAASAPAYFPPAFAPLPQQPTAPSYYPASHPVAGGSSQRMLFVVAGFGAGVVIMVFGLIVGSSLLSKKQETASADSQLPSTAGVSSPTSASPTASTTPSDSLSSTIQRKINDRVGSPGYATPEAAYEALRSAVRAQDWGKVYDCLTNERRERLIAVETLTLFLKKDDPEIAALMARHDLTESRIRQAQLVKAGTTTIGATPQQIEALKNLVSDPRSFFADCLAIQYRDLQARRQADPKSVDIFDRSFIDADLLVDFKDLHISGDRATGRFAGPDRVDFQKTERGWLVSQAITAWGASHAGRSRQQADPSSRP